MNENKDKDGYFQFLCLKMKMMMKYSHLPAFSVSLILLFLQQEVLDSEDYINSSIAYEETGTRFALLATRFTGAA